MNDERRKRIGTVVDSLKEGGSVRLLLEAADTARVAAKEALQEAHDEIELIKNEEADAYEAMSDNLKEAPNGQASSTAQDNLDSAMTDLDSAIDNFDNFDPFADVDDAVTNAETAAE